MKNVRARYNMFHHFYWGCWLFPHNRAVKRKQRGPYATVKSGNVLIPIYRITNKGYHEFRVVWYDAEGTRRQKAFANEGDARTHATNVQSAITSGSIKTVTLADLFAYQDALQAIKDLGIPINVAAKEYAQSIRRLHSASLNEAVDFFLKHCGQIQPRTVSQVIAELISSKRNPSINRSPASAKYVADLESRLGKFEEAFHCKIGDVQPEHIREFLDRLPAIGGRTWFNYARVIRTLFNFAQAKKYFPANIDPMEGIDIDFDDDGEIEVFTPEELTKLFDVARPEIIPFLAIAAFAGVRHAEIGRLQWEHISATHIEIKAAVSKNRRRKGSRARRIIPIQPNLAKWLAPHRQQSGPVAAFANMSKQLLWLAEEAGIKWRHNALRHSFISYRMAKTNDENLVAVEAGNSPAMIHANYRQIKDHTNRTITPELADSWFGIFPKLPHTRNANLENSSISSNKNKTAAPEHP